MWGDILAGLKQGGLDFEAVDRREWCARLAKSNPDVVENPTYKLLVGWIFAGRLALIRQNFYQNRIGKDEERPFMDFEVKQTSKVSPTIASCKATDPSLVALWVGTWKKSGFLQ